MELILENTRNSTFEVMCQNILERKIAMSQKSDKVIMSHNETSKILEWLMKYVIFSSLQKNHKLSL